MARQFREQLEQEADSIQRHADVRRDVNGTFRDINDTFRSAAPTPPPAAVAQGYQPPHLGEDIPSSEKASEPKVADSHERGQ